MTLTPPNETKNAKSKKILKFSPNDKKKTLYAIILQMHSMQMRSNA